MYDYAAQTCSSAYRKKNGSYTTLHIRQPMQKPSENDRVRYAMLPRLLDPTLALLREEEEEEPSYTPPR
jgi:hypothetical protein